MNTLLVLTTALLSMVVTYHALWRQQHDDIPDDPWLERFGAGDTSYEGRHRP